ncbi:uncharacterized protein LOC124490482 [Dermatophagoides farinae]|uniref:uncharacterized protein LOC124490482 n=1 Tax=Dermatophagoides farinae TaxID=6954 RepID=UPI003F610883
MMMLIKKYSIRRWWSSSLLLLLIIIQLTNIINGSSSSSSSSSTSSDETFNHHGQASWNFTQWWNVRTDDNTQLYNEPVVFQEPAKYLQQYGDFERFGQVDYRPLGSSTATSTSIMIGTNVFHIDPTFSPITSIDVLNSTIRQFFSRSRHWSDDKIYLRDLREALKDKFLSYGLKTAFHVFKTEYTQDKMKRQTATNIIAILPGKYRGTPKDEIYLIGAHYDTVRRSPGIDDNGSGSAAVLEMARLLTRHKCYFNKTIIFTLFDLEEEYLKGSKYFVQQYLIPTEIRKNQAKFNGAYIMDMLLAYNTTESSQSLRDFWPTLPAFVEEIQDAGSRGNFMTAWSRRNIDQDLFFFLEKNWKNKQIYPLKLMDPPLPTLSHEVSKNWSKYSKYGTFARSDHASFWYPIERDTTFRSILLSDLGPWRKDMSFHYHRYGDDERWLRYENLRFMKNTIDSLLATIIDIGDGYCFAQKI